MRLAPLALLLLLAGLLAARRGWAAEVERPPVVVWMTLSPAGDAPDRGPMHRPTPSDGKLYERAQELDATLRDAVQDLGYTLYVADTGPAPGRTRDEDLVERASRAAAGRRPESPGGGTWVVSPRLESAGGGDFVVRIVAVPPDARELRVRVETVASERVSVRGLVMLRDLLTPQAVAAAAAEVQREEAGRGAAPGGSKAPRSEGRAVLAVNGGLFGAYTAFSLEQASGSTDPRVLYPLLAVGTGIGVGAALLAADEWDVTSGDAWYLSAGGLWGAASGLLIANAENVQPSQSRSMWGVGGGLVGLGLATVAVTRTTMDEGDATLAHSGGALGLAFGATAQYLRDGSTASTPSAGMGYGAAIGLLGGGLLATRVTIAPSRMLLIDVGVGGGGLLGAAAASPLVFNNVTATHTREWLSASAGGGLLGGALVWWLTRDAAPKASWLPPGMPSAGVMATTPTRTGEVPAYGVGWSGRF